MNNSNLTKQIGGYFEWEFPPLKEFTLHSNAILLNSCRHALEFLLRGLKNISRVYMPYYTCDAVLVPLQRLGISYSFYRINEKLEIDELINLSSNEYLIYTNYFGIKDAYISHIVKLYGEMLIVDNAQALYCPAFATHQIYSPRKFIGMPDGGIAITALKDYSKSLPKAKSYDRCLHLLKRIELIPSEGYSDFKKVSQLITNSALSRMSRISENILKTVDFEYIKDARRKNFFVLHEALKDINGLIIPPMDSFACPLVYPFLTDNVSLKSCLIKEQVFVATYWPNVLEWTTKEMIENKFANYILAIPCDQRYGKEDMLRIISLIRN